MSQEALARLRSDLNKRGGAGTRAVGQRDGFLCDGFLCSTQRSHGLRGCLDTLGLGDSPKEQFLQTDRPAYVTSNVPSSLTKKVVWIVSERNVDTARRNGGHIDAAGHAVSGTFHPQGKIPFLLCELYDLSKKIIVEFDGKVEKQQDLRERLWE